MQVLARNERFLSGAVRDIFVSHLRARSSAADLEEMTSTMERWVVGRAAPVATLTIPDPGIGLPELGVRAVAADCMRRTNLLTDCQVIVLRGQGFWLSAARSVMTALAALSGSNKRPTFGNLDQATEYLAAHLGYPHTAVPAIISEVDALIRER